MGYVECVVSEGLRESEATVAVESLEGENVFLRVEKDFLKGSSLPVGVVHVDAESKRALIELPHEADSGLNRVWVPMERVKL
jgi:hypothetical protein